MLLLTGSAVVRRAGETDPGPVDYRFMFQIYTYIRDAVESSWRRMASATANAIKARARLDAHAASLARCAPPPGRTLIVIAITVVVMNYANS